ncbi:DUF6510 family protein [Agromyces tropicus]|uniref:DUF6510 family protein n=1 Tax=Agromyces tropicus TaxID=555371 RepID=A0ABN2UFK5_9MICO
MTGHVDGNAIAGPLADFFSFDITTASGRCKGCGTVQEFARTMVYVSGAGSVVRCPHCDNVLAVLVDTGERAWIDLGGVSSIEVRR